MKVTEQKLPQSRLKFTAELTGAEVDQYFESAVDELAPTVKLSGFRSGKAPKELIKQQLSSDLVREKASGLAVRAAWRQISDQLAGQNPHQKSQEPVASSQRQHLIPISDPEVMIELFDEGEAGKITFEFDIRPPVKVGAWQKITIKPGKDTEVTDADVAKLIESLSQGHATTTIKLEPAETGDRMELDFEGSIGGVRKDKLSAKNFPVIIGQGTTIPGFDAELSGLKKGQAKSFKLTFPKDHFDKELAGQVAEFKVLVNEVFKVILPELNEEFAKRFGHDTTKQLQEAIHADLVRQRSEEAFTTQKAKWLAEFERVVTVDVPKSLIEAEVERSRQAWRQFLQERHLNEGEWLTSRALTLAGLEKDWQTAAKASVTIGLGLAEVAAELKKELKTNDAFQALLDELVQKAIK